MTINTLQDFLIWAERAFDEADLYFGHGTDNAWDEAVAIARFVLELPPDASEDTLKRVLNDNEVKRLEEIASSRMTRRIPVPYLIHEAWFAGKKYYVDERVIIPRSPLGELILKRFSPWVQAQKPIRRILDLCTGSACIAIACAYAFPEARIDAIELSPEALAVAEKNIQLHDVSDRVRLIESDLFSHCEDQRYDIIISNPPYVDLDELETLPQEFHWEPKMALSGGQDGLFIIRRILREAPQYLEKSGLLIAEVGNSEEALKNAFPMLPFTWIEFEQGGQGVFLLDAEDIQC